VGIEDLVIWAGAAGTAVTAALGLFKAKIQADRDTRIAEIALRGSKPAERGQILEGLAKIRPFHPGSSEPEDESPAARGVIDKCFRALRRGRE
jgi:hypothetical protein